MNIKSAQFIYDPANPDQMVHVDFKDKSGTASIPFNIPDNRQSVELNGWVAQPGNKIKKAKIPKDQTNPPSVEITLLLDILVDKNVITLADKKRIAGEI